MGAISLEIIFMVLKLLLCMLYSKPCSGIWISYERDLHIIVECFLLEYHEPKLITLLLNFLNLIGNDTTSRLKQLGMEFTVWVFKHVRNSSFGFQFYYKGKNWNARNWNFVQNLHMLVDELLNYFLIV